MNGWNEMMSSLGVLGVLAVGILPWIVGIVVGWRVMRALERIASAVEVRRTAES